MKIVKITLILILLSILSPFLILKSHCQTGIVLYPSKGTALTVITLEAYVPINSRNNIFWDNDIAIALDVHRGQENYPLVMNISCPNYSPYSDLGNHTVTVESFYWDGSDKVAYFNTTFEIVEEVPDQKYLELLENYTQLWSNYTSLQANYTALNQTYYDLVDQYNTLLDKYNNLSADYDSLLVSYNLLSNSYNSMTASYNGLLNDFNNLVSNYFEAVGNYQALNDSYSDLQKTYDQLHTNYMILTSGYNSLQTNYNTLVSEIAVTRNVGYLFAVATMLFIATTAYFTLRKPKQEQPKTSQNN